MSKAIFIDIEGIRYNFYCRSEDTRHGFKHVAQMFVDGYLEASGVCYYLNRTWERWRYQSACLQAVNNRIKEIEENEMKCFKALHNYDRMTEKRKQEFQAYLNDSGLTETLQELKRRLKDNIY